MPAVLRAIHFNNETRGRTGEIDDEVSDRHLPSKMCAARLQAFQVPPQPHFGAGRILAQTLGCVAFESADGRRLRHVGSPHPARLRRATLPLQGRVKHPHFNGERR